MMTLSAAELKYQRANTRAFIAANPVRLTLMPRTKVKDGSGTRYTDGTARSPQTFRLIDQSSERFPQPGLIQTSDGRERLADFILLGEHNSTVQVWDYWTDADGTWEVAQVFPSNQYELRAVVVRRA